MLTADPVRLGTNVVLALYGAIDAGEASSAAPLFTQDAVWQTTARRAEGIEAIAQFLGDREADRERRTIHAVSNIRTSSTEEDHLEIDVLLTVYTPTPSGQSPSWAVEFVGGVTHVLRLDDGEWRIASRTPSRPGVS